MQISDNNSPLELTADQLRQDIEKTLEHLGQHITTLDQQPAWDLPDKSAGGIPPREGIPEHGLPLEHVLDDLFNHRLNPSYNPSCGGYLAYVPGGGLPHAAIADLISGILNKFVTLFQIAPSLSNIETDDFEWISS